MHRRDLHVLGVFRVGLELVDHVRILEFCQRQFSEVLFEHANAAPNRRDAAEACRFDAALHVGGEERRPVAQPLPACIARADGRRGSRPALISPMNSRSQSRASSIDWISRCLPGSIRGMANSLAGMRLNRRGGVATDRQRRTKTTYAHTDPLSRGSKWVCQRGSCQREACRLEPVWTIRAVARSLVLRRRRLWVIIRRSHGVSDLELNACRMHGTTASHRLRASEEGKQSRECLSKPGRSIRLQRQSGSHLLSQPGSTHQCCRTVKRVGVLKDLQYVFRRVPHPSLLRRGDADSRPWDRGQRHRAWSMRSCGGR